MIDSSVYVAVAICLALGLATSYIVVGRLIEADASGVVKAIASLSLTLAAAVFIIFPLDMYFTTKHLGADQEEMKIIYHGKSLPPLSLCFPQPPPQLPSMTVNE